MYGELRQIPLSLQVVHVPVAGTPPESYLGLSLFTLLFCCWIFGVIALLKSAQVSKTVCLVPHGLRMRL